MSFFTLQTLTVDLGGDNLVTLKKLNAGEVAAANSAATSKIDVARMRRPTRSTKPPRNGHGQQEEEAEPDIEIFLDLQTLVLERLARAVVSWEGPDFVEDGVLVPVSVANVKRLPQEVISSLNEAMAELNPASDSEREQEKKEA